MSNSLFLWTGISRKSEVILKDQNLQIKKNIIQDGTRSKNSYLKVCFQIIMIKIFII